MLRSLKRRTIAFRVTQPTTESQTTMKQVRHLPGCEATEKTPTPYRLADFESVGFVYPDIPTHLQVERRIPECLDARAIQEQVPAVKLFRCSDQREGRVSQQRGTALRMRDKERRQRIVGRDIYSRSDVAIKLSKPSGRGRSAATQCCCNPSSWLPTHGCCGCVGRFVYSTLRTQELFAYVSVTTLQKHLVHQAIRTGEIERYAGPLCLRRIAAYA